MLALAVVPVAAGVLGAAAGGGRGEAEGPLRAVRAFEAALASGRGEAACTLLAPDTRRSLEDSEKQPCPTAVLQAELPRDVSADSAEVFGDQALVRSSRQALFLTRASGSWVVTAAGCTPREDLPYECEVEGS
jgi:hypothetical protein